LRLAQDTALDAAILDVTIRGGKIYPAAERLRGEAARLRRLADHG
jgi:hypothetical protein